MGVSMLLRPVCVCYNVQNYTLGSHLVGFKLIRGTLSKLLRLFGEGNFIEIIIIIISVLMLHFLLMLFYFFLILPTGHLGNDITSDESQIEGDLAVYWIEQTTTDLTTTMAPPPHHGPPSADFSCGVERWYVHFPPPSS